MVIQLLVAALGGWGTWLVYSAIVLGVEEVVPRPRRSGRGPSQLSAAARAAGVGPGQLVGTSVLAGGVAGAAAWAVFGGVLAPLAVAALVAAAPGGALRVRAERARAEAHEAWPRMLEEVRVLTGTVGRSVPQALFEVGRRAPDQLRPAFAAAEREWRVGTDLGRALDVLRDELADPTADAVCETLLVAAEVGGGDLDARLAALAEDRAADLRHRKDARAAQAGVRFARRFVLAVPVGMALCGLSIGTGRRAYATSTGQALVLASVLAVAACWIWAGRLLRVPPERRVFQGARP